MNRRQFTSALGIITVALASGAGRISLARPSPKVAITMDDFAWNNSIKLTPEQRNQSISERSRRTR
ncbi:MAG: hypothetical protein ACRD8U_18915 [Pyrinomonadaceae bacterium]